MTETLPPPTTDLGTFVRDRRRAMQLTQRQLADLAGVGLNFVYQLEKNKPSVQLDCTRQVLHALGFELGVEARSVAGATAKDRSAPARATPWDE